MSVSIHYSASRDTPATADELGNIGDAVASMSVDDKIEAYLRGAQPDGRGEGLNWESFIVYDPAVSPPPVIFAGSTKLPDNTDDALWIGVQHWCELLTMIRRVLADARWEVRVQDHPIAWDETQQRYDPRT